MALLNFPANPNNGDFYPTNPTVGQNQYEYEAASQTWRLLGPATGVTPGCYGDALTVPTFCVDAQGRISSVVDAIIGPLVSTVNTGVGLLGGPITTTGTISLDIASNVEVQAGVNSTKAVVSSALQSKISNSISTTSSTTIASSTAVKTAYDLADAAVPKSTYTAKGEIIAGTGIGSYTPLTVGSNGQYLRADSVTATGLVWSNPPAFYNLDDVSPSFDGLTTVFSLTVGGLPYTPTPSSNIMVFLGGVAQTPGLSAAYVVAGSTITFSTAPAAGTDFYATTIF